MSEAYFAPMFGGLMLPLTRRQGSNLFQSGSSMYALNNNNSDPSTPLSASMTSPFAEVSSSSPNASGFYGERLPPATAHQPATTFHFKRYRSDDSMSTDTSPAGVRTSYNASPLSLAKNPRTMTPLITAAATDEFLHRPAPSRPTTQHRNETKYKEEDFPSLKLGDEGRARLKAALSEKVRIDPAAKIRVHAIGKIRLASMNQLMRMAKAANMWDFVENLAQEHHDAKYVKRRR